MKDDIRRQTAIIIEKDGEYLIGFSLFLRWGSSYFDAWRTRDVNAAQMVASKIGGNMMLFNPIAGQIRKYRGQEIDETGKFV